MASRFHESCPPFHCISWLAHSALAARQGLGYLLLAVVLSSIPARSQVLIKPAEPGDALTIMPSDMTIFESSDSRKEIPCTVTPRKTDLGFDLRFHTGFDVLLPLNEVAGEGGMLTVVFRVVSQASREDPSYFVQHFNVPTVADDAKGDALLQGEINVGEGTYHVDWLMRDRTERICSSSWDVEAALAPKDKPMNLFLPPNKIAESPLEPFVNDHDSSARISGQEANLNLKLLVNFAPQDSLSSALQRSDTQVLA